MRFALARHFAGRVARPRTLALCAALPLLWAALDGGPAGGAIAAPVAPDAAVRDLGRAAWVTLSAALLVLAAAAGASAGSAYRRRDNAWLGRSGLTLPATFTCAFLGLASGLGALTVAGAAAHGAAFPGAAERLELSATAGPEGSVRLLPGESLAQSLAAVPRPGRARVRLRLVPTVGGTAPTSAVEVAFDGGAPRPLAPVVRRTWVDAPLPEGASGLTLTNAGDGAVALVGPRGIEVWAERQALLGGVPRLGLRLLTTALWTCALAFGLSAWMGPGIAGLLALSLLLALGRLLPVSPLGGLADALEAVAEGRLARGVAPVEGLALAASAAIGVALFSAGAQRREVQP